MPREPSTEELEQLRDAIFKRRKIEAIKLYRQFKGCDLLEAKNFVEKLTADLELGNPEKFAPQPKGCSVSAILFLVIGIAFLFFLLRVRADGNHSMSLASLDEALAAKQDLWGLAAIRQPNGPNYEFFEKLLPPVRYVNAAFKHYPITLSAPGAPVKARLISNGSGVNLPPVTKTWNNLGAPIEFRVGADSEVFGSDLKRLHGPVYERGYLPIVQIDYEKDGAIYSEQSFAATEPRLSSNGVVFVRFQLKKGKSSVISAKRASDSPVKLVGKTLVNTNGHTVFWFSENWKWNEADQTLSAKISAQQPAFLAIATKALAGTAPIIDGKSYANQFAHCLHTWESLLARGAKIETPEPVVNNAYRSLLIQNYALVNGDEPRYSHGNAYDRLYQAECDDTATAFMLYGFAPDTGRMVSRMFDYTRDQLEFHNAGFKLQTLARHYWLTRDINFLENIREKWTKEIARIADGREADSGLPPRERYCGDIATKVYSLHASAAGWRGLRDFAAVLNDIGEKSEGERLAKIATDFRQKIFAAVDKSIFTNTEPPFIPIALFGEEKPHDPLTATMLGSYWNLIAPYVLGSEVFGHGSQRERWMLDYLQEKGGVFMGMIRFHQHSGLFANEDAVDDSYGLRYVTTLARLDKVDRLLVAFYGKLAQGMTRNTFVGAEGTGLRPLDEFGRPMYLPPNSTANSHWLFALRHLLVQDFDLDDDGKPETLRLLFATPKNWLADGKEMQIENAPTAFGEVSVHVKSRLNKGEVIVEVKTPQRNPPEKTFLRIRVPDCWKIISAKTGSQRLAVDETGAMDVSKMKGNFTVRVKVTNF